MKFLIAVFSVLAAVAVAQNNNCDDTPLCRQMKQIYDRVPEIAQRVEAVCDRLPGSLSSICHRLVSEFSPRIVKLVQDKLKEGAVMYGCTLGGNVFVDQRSCDSQYCDMVVQQYNNLDAVVGQLGTLCDRIPSDTLTRVCQQVFEALKPSIKDYLKKQFEAAAQQGGCDLGGGSDARSVFGLSAVEDCNETPICKYLQVAYNRASDIVEKLKERCDSLPTDTLSDFCRTLIERYGSRYTEFSQKYIVRFGTPLGCDFGGNLDGRAMFACESDVCGKVTQLYNNADNYVDQMAEECKKIPGTLFPRLCREMFRNIKPTIVTFVQNRIRSLAPQFGCEIPA